MLNALLRRRARKMVVHYFGSTSGIRRVFILYLLQLASADLIISTTTGLMQGVNSLETDVEAFLGVPYAEPPIGDKRFSKPFPKKKWYNTYSASKLPPPCVQSSFYPYYFMPDIANMSEDCLYLNIWAPKENNDDELKAVVIFFHSGAFVTGSSNQKTYDGSHLASRGDLVVVTINYRLGALGFFLAYTEEADGNMGMYDQLMAIKWVKANAKQFSGDPDKLVLMGVSAGAISVSNHIASPLSNHLFKRAIIESGASLNPAFMKNDKLFESSKKLAAVIGCTNATLTLKNNPQSVVQCLKEKPKEAFADAEKILLRANPILFYPRNNDDFLPERIVDVLRGGQFGKKIDLLCGVTEDEGSMMMVTGLHDYFGYYGRKQENKMNKFRAITLSRGAVLVSGVPNVSGIIDVYLNNLKNRTSVEYTKMVANLIGDFSISCCTIFLADFLSLGGSSVYFYKFEYRTSSTPMAEWVGATHLDEVQYVFGNPYHKNFTTQEAELSHLLIDRWSAFAKTGNPNIPGHIPWFRYSYQTPVYLNFGQEKETIQLRPNNRCESWRKVFDSEVDQDLIRYLSNSKPNTSDARTLGNSIFLISLQTFTSLFCNFVLFHKKIIRHYN